MDNQPDTYLEKLTGSIPLSVFLITVAFFVIGLGGCKKSPSQTENTTQPHALEPANSDGGLSDEIIRKFFFFSEGRKFKRGSTLVSTGGHGVPEGTLLFPVRLDPNPSEYNHFYFFRDEFGDWKVMWQQGESKVQIVRLR